MTIALDVGPLKRNPAGVGIYVRSLAEGLARIGAGELVYIGRRHDATGLPGGVPSVSRSARVPYPIWVELLGRRDVGRAHAEVAHFTDGLVPVIRAGRTVVTIHDLSVARWSRTHPPRRWLRMPFLLAAPRLAGMVLVPSRATADELMQLTGIAARKISIVPYAPQAMPAIGDGLAHEALARFDLARTPYILTVGTIEPRKNHIRLVEGFELAIASGSLPADMRLVIAGSRGWGSSGILSRIDASPVTDRIQRLGYVPSSELGPLLYAAAAVAYVSIYEGFGLPVVEAMASGAPTVTSNISSMPEVAGDAGFLVDPFDPAAIARGLAEAVRAGEEDAAGVRARSMAQASQFTWERTARETLAAYRTILS